MIVTVTLNPAIDKFYQVRQFEPGKMTRVPTCSNSAGGKGINVSKAASLLGETVLAMGFLGGRTGRYLLDLLSPYQIKTSFTEVPGETRYSVSIRDISTGQYTDLLEPGQPVREEDWERFQHDFQLAAKLADGIVLSGSIPPGVPEDAYSLLIRYAAQIGKPVLLDASGAVLARSLEAKPYFVKPNQQEASEFTGKPITCLDDAAEAALSLHQSGIPAAVISLGAHGAVLACEHGIYRGIPPQVKPVNTVGCGDSMVAGFAVGLVRGLPYTEQFRYGLACSAANTLTAESGSFRPKDFRHFLRTVEIQKYSG